MAETSQDYALKSNQKFRITAALMSPGARGLCAAAITASLIAAAAPLSAQQAVPIPKPAPKGRDGMQMSDTTRAPVTTGATRSAPPEPVIPDPHRNVPASIFTSFDANQKAQAAKVSNYLSSLQTLVGNFVQVGPDGTKTKGDFYIQKPGKVRFEYDPPNPIDIIADGSSLVVRDRKLATQDIYPLSQTPLRFLLSDRIDLLKDTTVTSVSADDTYVTVVVEERHVVVGTSRLMLMFGAKDFQLKQWIVTDPQGYDTTVALSNLDTAKRPDPDMFRIDYTQYPN